MSRVLSLLALTLIMAAPVNAFAVTILDADLSDSLLARISDHDPNRIRIADGYIASAVGPKNGRIAIETNDKQGEIFIRINANDPDKDKAFTLFLTDAHGRDYNLLLKPRAIAGKSIMIIRSHTSRLTGKHKRPVGISIRESRIKRLVRDMAMGNDTHRCTAKSEDRKTLLWQGTDFRLRRTIKCGDFSGERYTLTNISHNGIRIAEQELYSEGVAAISVARMHLRAGSIVSLDPGKSTTVIIIRDATE